MTLTVEISPEVQTALDQQAAASGLGIGAYVTRLLEQTAHLSPVRPPTPPKDMMELFAPLRGLNLTFERDRDTGRDIEL